MAISGVTGTLTHGLSVTIAGSSFGTKSTPAPIIYDDFQSVAVGDDIVTSTAGGGLWQVSGGNEFDPVASTRLVRSGTPFTKNWQSQWSGIHNRDGSGFSGSSNLLLEGDWNPRFFLSGWFYIDITGVLTGPHTSGFSNNKPFRVNQTGGDQDGSFNPATASGTGSGSSAEFLDGWYAAQRDGVNRSDSDSFDSGSSVAMANTWHHWQYLCDAGSGNNTEDGTIVVYIDGTVRFNHVGSIPTTAPGQTGGWQQCYVGNYMNNNNGDWTGTVYQYWESVYIDNSWARVEIGNNATYTSCTHREMWIPSAWSGSSITATVNRGSFGASDPVYLFVVNSSNTPSAGFQITLGSGAAASPRCFMVRA